MTYVVNESCIKCKYMDCVEVCPVDCFYEGLPSVHSHNQETIYIKIKSLRVGRQLINCSSGLSACCACAPVSSAGSTSTSRDSARSEKGSVVAPNRCSTGSSAAAPGSGPLDRYHKRIGFSAIRVRVLDDQMQFALGSDIVCDNTNLKV